jgi:hypothetical protein
MPQGGEAFFWEIRLPIRGKWKPMGQYGVAIVARFWFNCGQPLKTSGIVPFEAVIGIKAASFEYSAVAAGNK